MKDTKRNKTSIKWITGLKGFCCLTVVALHLLACVAPTAQNAGNKYIEITGMYNLFQLTPLSYLFNGSFSVYVFWTLSSFLMSYSYYVDNEVDLCKKEISKFIRIASIVLPVSILAFIALRSGLYYNVQAGGLITNSFWINERDYSNFTLKLLFIELIWKGWFGQSYLIPPMWTMQYEFFGSIFTIFLLKTKAYKNCKVLTIFATLLAVSRLAPYLCFIFGMLLAKIYYEKRNLKLPISILCWVIGILLGSYPPTGIPVDGAYAFLYNQVISKYNAMFGTAYGVSVLYSIAAFLIILGIMNTRILDNVYSNYLLVWVGERSTGIYLCHVPIIMTIGAYVFYKSSIQGNSYQQSIALCSISTLSCVLYVASIIDLLKKAFFKKYLTILTDRIFD